jgi:hypothetical protein
MKGQLSIVDIHQQLGQRESNLQNGKVVPAPMIQMILGGEIDGVSFQLGLQAGNTNLIHGLGLGDKVEITIDIPHEPVAFKVVK